ncbi:MAG TPA: hypothetical protein VD948_02470 [Rhodothermales bacterium]|nr:hypothetical protein [Rhodothermales bacterium]
MADGRVEAPGLPAYERFEIRRRVRYVALGATKAPEVWIALHGYGQLAAYFARPFRRLAGAHRRVLLPEAPSRFYLDDTYRRIGASWMTREDREAEIADLVAYLDAFAAHAVPPGARLCGLGFSQGAHTLSRWAAFGHTPLHRLVLWGAGLPDDLDLAAHRGRLQPLTLVVGDDDHFLTPERMAAHAQRVEAAALPCEVVRYDGDHRIDEAVLRQVLGA